MTDKPEWTVDQTKFGKPDGNCFAACLASIFGLPLDDIPEFHTVSGESGWWFHFNEWSREHGYEVLMVRGIDHAPVGMKCIASGMSGRGLNHAVVWEDGKIKHDPHPSRDGFVDNPTSYIYFIASHAPSAMTEQQAKEVALEIVERLIAAQWITVEQSGWIHPIDNPNYGVMRATLAEKYVEPIILATCCSVMALGAHLASSSRSSSRSCFQSS